MCMSPDMVAPTAATKAQVMSEDPLMYIQHYWESGDPLPEPPTDFVSIPVERLRIIVAYSAHQGWADYLRQYHGR